MGLNLDKFISRYEYWAEDESISENIRKEHRQLAEWLKELKQLREQTRWIPVARGCLKNLKAALFAINLKVEWHKPYLKD